MATSSILTELVIEDPKKAEAFINALEMSSQEPVCSPSAPSIPILDSVEDIRSFLYNKKRGC
mgnify:CR=1 FL=1